MPIEIIGLDTDEETVEDLLLQNLEDIVGQLQMGKVSVDTVLETLTNIVNSHIKDKE